MGPAVWQLDQIIEGVTAMKLAPQKMTASDAKTFGRQSIQNMAVVLDARKCDCEPYRDFFTYGRWRAQGYQVRKGQHGIKLAVVINVPVEDDGKQTTRSLRRTSSVFCRHQVDPVH
jgi:hypothetical protein